MNRIPYQELDSYPGEYGCTTYRDEPFTGIAYSARPDGSLVSEWIFRNGELWGPHRDWHSDGTLTSATYFVAGVAHGASREWYPDGRKLCVEFLQYGNQVRGRSFAEDGRIWCDFAMARDSPALTATRRLMESLREEHGPLIEAEPIPPEYLRIEEDEWRETCWRYSYDRAHVKELDTPPGHQTVTTLRGQPFTGVGFATRVDGVVEREWVLRDGLLWGMQRGWKNGTQRESAGYAVAGMKHGAWREWWAGCRGEPLLSIEWYQFGVLLRAKKWVYPWTVTLDYRLEEDANAPELLRTLESRREQFAGLIEAEGIPGEYLQVGEHEWEHTLPDGA